MIAAITAVTRMDTPEGLSVQSVLVLLLVQILTASQSGYPQENGPVEGALSSWDCEEGFTLLLFLAAGGPL